VFAESLASRPVSARLLVPAVLAVALVAALAGLGAADGIMLVEAGAFWMGRDDGPAEEAPRHRVYVRDFWIERHKVTNAEFAAFLTARGPVSPAGEPRYDHDDADARIRRAPSGTGSWRADPGYEHHPAVEVSWFGARDFCAWRGRRLPTEAEWEKAARGDDGRPYPWGAAPPSPARAVYGRGYNATEPTHATPEGASPYGVHDLLGNLREWTSTSLAPYPYRDDDGREPFDGRGRVVVRGASHDDPADALRATVRRSYDRRGAAAGHHHVGFRCATSEDLGER
jgi:formylglycine-generating enzyme required for sulfatase activity